MEQQIRNLESVSEYCNFFGVEVLHPLVTVADFQDYGTYPAGKMQSGLYCIMYKELECGEMKYGRSKYDYQAGTLLFISPGQIIGLNGRDENTPKSKGLILMIHPDLMYGTPLARLISDYSFFSYGSNEALHMSDKEKNVILNCFSEIKAGGHLDFLNLLICLRNITWNANRFHPFQLETVLSKRLSTDRKESIHAFVLSMLYLRDRSSVSRRYF